MLILKRCLYLIIICSVGVSFLSRELFSQEKIIHQSGDSVSVAQPVPTQEHAETGVAGIQSFLERMLAKPAGLPFYFMIFITFLAGVLTSFTPCIYPMIPITIGILQTQMGSSVFYNFLSSLFYVFGLSLVYASLGYLAATTHIIFGQWLANPFFIFFITLFFLYFAFSLFGFYELAIPSFLRSRSTIQSMPHKNLISSFLYGVISGTIASPCLTPALALVLSLAAQTASPIAGFFYLLSFSFGMGILLVLVGTFSSTLTLLPQAGVWMEEIKRVFGFICLALAVSFLDVFVPKTIILELYSLVIFIAAVYYFVSAKSNKLKIILGLLLLLLAAILLGLSIKYTFIS